jgi:hypothetical protein
LKGVKGLTPLHVEGREGRREGNEKENTKQKEKDKGINGTKQVTSTTHFFDI